MITKNSSKKEDSKLLQGLLKKAIISQNNFRKISDTNGQQTGLPIGGSAFLNEYKKADKRYRYNYEKAAKKYFDKGRAYQFIASYMKEIIVLNEKDI